MKKRFDSKPEVMNEIHIPLKNEIRSRARILTDEAFRETRNYLNLDSEILNSSNNQKSYNLINSGVKNKQEEYATERKSEIRQILNKLTVENYSVNSDIILRMNYDQNSMENLKVKEFLFKFI